MSDLWYFHLRVRQTEKPDYPEALADCYVYDKDYDSARRRLDRYLEEYLLVPLVWGESGPIELPLPPEKPLIELHADRAVRNGLSVSLTTWPKDD
jgi:hypothetical protein